MKNKLASISPKPFEATTNEIYNQLETALQSGNLRRYRAFLKRRAISDVITDEKINQIISTTESHINTLLKLNQTIHRLYLYTNEYDWPLEEPWKSKYHNVLNKYVFPTIGKSISSPNVTSPDECAQLRKELISSQQKRIGEIFTLLPSRETLKEIATQNANQMKDELNSQVEDLEEIQKSIQIQSNDVVSTLYNQDQPSFTECFYKEAQKENISVTAKKIQNSAKVYAGSWLKPETIASFVKAFSST